MGKSLINFLVKVRCNPSNKLQTRRDALRTVLEIMEKHGVEVPYQQIDIHNK